MADVSDGTAAGLLDFLEWAGSRGEINAGTASSRAVAVRRVLDIEGMPLEGIDIRGLDVDSVLDRFETLKRTDYSSDSMDVYKSRFRSSVNSYLAWLDKSPDWKRAGRPATGQGNRASATKRKINKPKNPSTGSVGADPKAGLADQEGTGAPAVDPGTMPRMIPYEVPLRPGTDMRVRLVLPDDLTKADADRLSRFIQSLAFGPSDMAPRESAPGSNQGQPEEV